MSTKIPTVSIAIITYNESEKIEQVLRSFISNNYPHIIEIFVADGGSNDGTIDIVTNLSTEDLRVKLIHNPQTVQAARLNLILNECRGDIFLRVDAHSNYAHDYVEQCVEALLESEACNVGGAQRFVAETSFQAGIALASRSWLGNGGAKYRDSHYNGYADTVYLGCFWKKCLLEIQGYCVETTYNEDAELNLRLKYCKCYHSQNQAAKSNQKLSFKGEKTAYISSKIRVWYYPRKTWTSLFTQYFRYGKGRYLTSEKHSKKLQMRGLLPFFVISTIILLFIVDLIFTNLYLPTKLIIIGGVFLPFLESLRITLKFRQRFEEEMWRGNQERIPSFFYRWLFCGIALLTMPLAHFFGYACQLFRCKVLKCRCLLMNIIFKETQKC